MVMETEFALTTFDNPFDPFEQFTSWLLFDNEKGYNSCGILARTIDRINDSIEDLSQKEKDSLIEQAIDEIILYDDLNIYKKVKRTTEIIEPIPVEE